MRSAQILRSMAAGFIATLAMTAATYTIPLIEVRQVEPAVLLGSLLGRQRLAPQHWAWWLGMGLHFLNGSLIFPLVYATLVPWLSGLWWGALLWILLRWCSCR